MTAALLAALLLATEPPAQPQEPEEPGLDLEVPADDESGWLDLPHEKAEEGLGQLVLRLDRFFGEASHADFDEPGSRVRLRLESRAGEDVRLDGRASVRADLRLPAANRLLRRASIYLAGQTDDDTRAAAEDPLRSRLDAQLHTSGGALELRYEILRAPLSVVDAGAGIRFGLPPPPYLRIRWAQAVPTRSAFALHFAPQLFWQREEEFGASLRADLERPLGTRTLARLWGVGTVHEHSRGLEWHAETGVQRALGERTGVYVAGAVRGATRFGPAVDVWRLFTRLRRDVHRGWLFLELEPEVSWPADRAAGAVLAATVRLEIQLETGSYADEARAARASPRDLASASRE